ncbi:MAG: hypothetical protein ACU84Q_05300 [Gammaproteobacteria bacterium]
MNPAISKNRDNLNHGGGRGAAFTTGFAAVAMTTYLWVQIAVVLTPFAA